MRRAIAVLAAVTVLLSGCVGIPTSSGVVAGPVIDADTQTGGIEFAPSGPTPGADPQSILEGFMFAQRGPQDGYAIAKQFLTRDMAATWKPDESATIRTGIPAYTPGPAPDTLNYTVTSLAVVDADGRYFEQEPAAQTFAFTFEKENDEWRISVAPNGIVLSEASFDFVFLERALYFFDPSYAFLVPDVRWFPSRTTIPTRIVSSLLTGPASWLQQGVVLTAFPIATSVVSVEITSGAATVELSQEALAASPEERDRMRQQLAATLGVATVIMRVGGLELQTPDVGVGAVKNPRVEDAVLVGTGEEFGFATGEGISPIDGVSTKVIASGALAATLSADKQSAAILAPNGVSVVRANVDNVQLLDQRPGLIQPSLDPFRFIWSVQASNLASLIAFEVDGTDHPIPGLPADESVVSIDVSRDGTRLLVYSLTSIGPQLTVYGIIRQQGSNVPTALGEPLKLPVVASRPVDATWVDERTVATVSRAGDVSPVTLVEIGGPSTPLSQLTDAKTIAGGNNATDGVRVLRPDGEIWRTQGGGWVATGLTASLLGTKQ